MLNVYLDESGIHTSSDVALMCGMIARAEDWTEFESDWNACLDEVGIPYFHGAELSNIQGQHGYLSQPLRDYLWHWLPKVIARHGLGIISTGIVREDLERICSESPEFAKWFSEPYSVCMEGCLQGAMEWSNRNASGEPVALIYSKQDQYRQKSLDTFDYYKRDSRWADFLVSISFVDMRKVAPLQAADLVAGQLYKTIRSYLGKIPKEYNDVIGALSDAGIQIAGGLITYEDMRRWISEGPAFYLKK